MSLGLSPLLSKLQTLAMAKRTLKLAQRAAVKGDLRLGISRAITAVIQASIAAVKSSNKPIKIAADNVIQDARTLIMGIVVTRAEVSRMRKLG